MIIDYVDEKDDYGDTNGDNENNKNNLIFLKSRIISIIIPNNLTFGNKKLLRAFWCKSVFWSGWWNQVEKGRRIQACKQT